MSGDQAAEPTPGVTLRPLLIADLPAVLSSARAAIAELHHRPGVPNPQPTPPQPTPPQPGGGDGAPVLRRLVELDPDGAWVAEVGDEIVGAAVGSGARPYPRCPASVRVAPPTSNSPPWWTGSSAALAESGPDDVAVPILRTDQYWGLDVARRAGLSLQPTGPLCRIGATGPRSAYLPHTGLL